MAFCKFICNVQYGCKPGSKVRAEFKCGKFLLRGYARIILFTHTSEGGDFTHFQNVHTQIYFPIGNTSTFGKQFEETSAARKQRVKRRTNLCL